MIIEIVFAGALMGPHAFSLQFQSWRGGRARVPVVIHGQNYLRSQSGRGKEVRDVKKAQERKDRLPSTYPRSEIAHPGERRRER
jgi:hypothetical protein